MIYMSKDNLEKTKEKLLLNLDEANFVKDFKIGQYVFSVKAPSVLEEAKISIKKYDAIRKLIELDEDFKNYLLTLEVKELKLDEDGKLKTETHKLDYNNNHQLENVFNNINSVYQDLILRLAYLDVVLTGISNSSGEKIIEGKLIQNLDKLVTLNIRLNSLAELTNSVVEWVKTFEVDPFLLKN